MFKVIEPLPFGPTQVGRSGTGIRTLWMILLLELRDRWTRRRQRKERSGIELRWPCMVDLTHSQCHFLSNFGRSCGRLGRKKTVVTRHQIFAVYLELVFFLTFFCC